MHLKPYSMQDFPPTLQKKKKKLHYYVIVPPLTPPPSPPPKALIVLPQQKHLMFYLNIMDLNKPLDSWIDSRWGAFPAPE